MIETLIELGRVNGEMASAQRGIERDTTTLAIICVESLEYEHWTSTRVRMQASRVNPGLSPWTEAPIHFRNWLVKMSGPRTA